MNKDNKNSEIYILDSQNNFLINSKEKLNINLNRVAFIFIIILVIFVLYTTRVIFLSSTTLINKNVLTNQLFRADIVDRNGNYISKSVFTKNIGIDPKLVKDKKKFLIKLKITFPEKDFTNLETN